MSNHATDADNLTAIVLLSTRPARPHRMPLVSLGRFCAATSSPSSGMALRYGDIVGPALNAEDLFKYSSLRPGMGARCAALRNFRPAHWPSCTALLSAAMVLLHFAPWPTTMTGALWIACPPWMRRPAVDRISFTPAGFIWQNPGLEVVNENRIPKRSDQCPWHCSQRIHGCGSNNTSQ